MYCSPLHILEHKLREEKDLYNVMPTLLRRKGTTLELCGNFTFNF